MSKDIKNWGRNLTGEQALTFSKQSNYAIANTAMRLGIDPAVFADECQCGSMLAIIIERYMDDHPKTLTSIKLKILQERNKQ